ncbi:MAG: imidazole glycerol phosphate synthase subunit HisH [Prevotellaceae bacterium]|nr:imidazole glycerol phosphate synthase subunit HisH [Prevotellaceae bacterium]
MNVAIVKYNAGNIGSVENAVRRLGIEPTVTDVPELICGADRVIFPGQGEARSTMAYLKAHRLDEVIVGLKQPVLGICIGMQLLCRHSEEQDTDCLGVFDAEVKRFVPKVHEDKVPQMGWNTIEDLKSPLFAGLGKSVADAEGTMMANGGKGGGKPDFVYFVHSYYVPLCDATIATTNYIQPYSSALHKGNFYATQFHPEKSGTVGERILKNFIELV